MASWADEISAIIEKNIAGFGASETAEASVGTVIAVQDGIARVYGLQDVKYLELVEFHAPGSWAWPLTSKRRRSVALSWAISQKFVKTTKYVPQVALFRYR